MVPLFWSILNLKGLAHRHAGTSCNILPCYAELNFITRGIWPGNEILELFPQAWDNTEAKRNVYPYAVNSGLIYPFMEVEYNSFWCKESKSFDEVIASK